MAAKLGHLALEIKPKIHEIIKLELKISLVVQSACFYHFSFRFESISKMKGYEGKIAASISVEILTFFTNFNISWLWMDSGNCARFRAPYFRLLCRLVLLAPLQTTVTTNSAISFIYLFLSSIYEYRAVILLGNVRS